MSRRAFVLLFATPILFLVCNWSLFATSDLLNDLDRRQNDYSDLRVNEESAQTVTINETYRLDNCGGTRTKNDLTSFGTVGHPYYEIEGTLEYAEVPLQNKYG